MSLSIHARPMRERSRAVRPPHRWLNRGLLALEGHGASLDAVTRATMERRFNHDFSRVRVHPGGSASRSAGVIGAHAYTVGEHIVFSDRAYAPDTTEGQRLLAHELTHVVQQTGAPGPEVSPARAEAEAECNSQRVAAGNASRPISAAPAGAIQRQDKPKTSVSGERTGTKEGKDKFGFKAEVTVPLTPDLEFGAVSFLDELKLTGAGGVTGEALGASSAELEDLKLQLALTLAKLELATTKDKAKELREGKLSLGATLSATGGATLAFDPFDPKGSLGASLTAKAGATTPSLLPSRFGELTLGSSITATGSATGELTAEGATATKAEGKAAFEASYKSPAYKALSLGGVLGKKAQVTAGYEESISASITPEKAGGKISVGGSLGLAGKGKEGERFIKIQITGDVGIDRAAGSAAASTKSIFVGATTGFKF